MALPPARFPGDIPRSRRIVVIRKNQPAPAPLRGRPYPASTLSSPESTLNPRSSPVKMPLPSKPSPPIITSSSSPPLPSNVSWSIRSSTQIGSSAVYAASKPSSGDFIPMPPRTRPTVSMKTTPSVMSSNAASTPSTAWSAGSIPLSARTIARSKNCRGARRGGPPARPNPSPKNWLRFRKIPNRRRPTPPLTHRQ